MNKMTKIFLIVSIILFVISLTQKTYCLEGNCNARGFLDLLIGWLGVLSKDGSSAWLANPLLLVSWLLILRKPKLALIFSLVAFVFAFRFYFQDTMIKNEAGMVGKITGYKSGYWLWLSSIAVLICGSLFSIIKQG